MTAEMRTMVKAAALAIAAILFLIGGFLDPTDYETTVTMWGVGFTLVTVTLLLDLWAKMQGGPEAGS